MDDLQREDYTPWFERVLAPIIDNIPLAILLGAGPVIAGAIGGKSCTIDPSRGATSCSPSGMGSIITVIFYLVALAYWFWNWGYRQGATGSSIGKSVLKFKVVSERTGQPIGFVMSVVRQIAHFIDYIICGIGYLLPLFTAKRQTIADMIMGTVCVPIESTWAAPQQPPQPPTARRSRTPWIIAGVAAVVVLAGAAVGISAIVAHNKSRTAPTSQVVELPFTGLRNPGSVAVDTSGDIYITDSSNDRVLELRAGSSTPIELPFTGVHDPTDVAVDTIGNVYVTEYTNNRVAKLAAGSSTPIELPFTGLNNPAGVAVDTAGDVYVTDRSNNRVVKLAAGSSTQTVLPFTGLSNPLSVAVDTSGDIYITDSSNNRVLELPAGLSTQTELPFTGLKYPEGVAVDTTGDVYITDSSNNRVLKLAAGSSAQSVLPFTGLNLPAGVAVDTAGDLYVTDNGNNRVLKLPAG